MILTKLEVTNMGLFKGVNTFNLKPDFSNGVYKPIILIGGKNGAGKTTLFESILLCLYGPSIYSNKLKKSEYERFIQERIHHDADNSFKPIEASISVEFEYSHLGKDDVYFINRSWNLIDKKVEESLTIKRNNALLNDLEVDQWQDFLNELIPPRFSRLFFFDGEKIQSLADDEDNNAHLKESFKTLLGLDLVERAQGDLKIYIMRNVKSSGLKEIKNNINLLKDQQKNFEDELDINRQELAQKQSSKDQILGDIERQETLIAGEGGSFANKRNELKLTKSKLDNDIETVRNNIRDLCNYLLPFAITPKYCKLLKERLIEEDSYQNRKIAEELINNKIKDIDTELRSPNLWDDIRLDYYTQSTISKRVLETINRALVPKNDSKNISITHNFSHNEQQQILTWIELSTKKIPNQAIKLSRRLEKLIRERQKVEHFLANAPGDDVLNPYIQKLNQLNKELGEITVQIKSLDEKIRLLEYKNNDCIRQINLELEKIKLSDETSNKAKLANNAQIVLKEYVSILQKEKINELSNAFLIYFNKLLRKDDFIKNIAISENNFLITLYDRGGNAIPKQKLSAGEKQVYAISMLWALTKTSGRPLPFVIDTPLGRLDSEHREKLVTGFFPIAGQQMIILSTDTEIDKEYFKTLSPSITRAYHLEYSKQGFTKITEGYFWDTIERSSNELH